MIVDFTQIVFTNTVLLDPFGWTMDTVERFGYNVARIRKQLELSQEELARQANIDRSYVSKIELGKCCVSIVIAEKIASTLNVEVGDLFIPVRATDS